MDKILEKQKELISKEQIDSLTISKFIFHVVHHGDKKPKLLKETPIKGFEDFFLERVRDTLKGNRFEFNPKSSTLKLIKEISEDEKRNINQDESKFVKNSKILATNFHSTEDKRIKAGVLIVMRLLSGEKEFFALIKYDHEQVISYDLQEDERAILKEIKNSFIKEKRALHKSAFISLNNEGGDLIIIDRTVHYDISDFFKKFLDVKRKHSKKGMTNAVQQAVIKTALRHSDELPSEKTSQIRAVACDVAQTQKTFSKEDYVDKVFGAHSTEKIKKTFNSELKERGIEDESFEFDPEATTPPKMIKYRTQEGVRIQYGRDAKHTVKIDKESGDKLTTITIKTSKLIEE